LIQSFVQALNGLSALFRELLREKSKVEKIASGREDLSVRKYGKVFLRVAAIS